MSILRKSLKGSFELSVGQALIYSCSFIRIAILARILDKADFGIAATFSITITILEMVGNISLNRLIVQSEEGDSPSFQGMLHFLEASRGLLNAAVLFILAWPVSHFFNIPEARWAFQCLAVVPLLRGFVHLDINRLEREMNFRPRVAAEVIPQILITAAAWPMAEWLKDYTAILWLLLAKGLCTMAVSHFTAQRPYRWSWENSYLLRALKFGWPLMVNSLLLYLVSQGDRLLVGSQYNMENLAVYTVAISLAMTPGQVLDYIVRTVMLPILARFQGLPVLFGKAYFKSSEIVMILSGLIVGILIIMGQTLLVVVFGDKYSIGATLMIPLAMATGIGIIRSVPATALMALGDTKSLMYANLIRCIGFAVAVVVAIATLPLVWIAWSSVFGNLLALVAMAKMLAVKNKKGTITLFTKAGLIWGFIIVSVFLIRSAFIESDALSSILSSVFFSILWLAASWILFRDLRSHIICAIQDFTQKERTAHL